MSFRFCPSCGTTLYWELEIYPELLGVAAGAFPDPALPPPQAAVWTQHQYDWVRLPDSVVPFAHGSAGRKTRRYDGEVQMGDDTLDPLRLDPDAAEPGSGSPPTRRRELEHGPVAAVPRSIAYVRHRT